MFVNKSNSIQVKILLSHYRGKAEEIGLLNTGATESFINHTTVAKLRLGTKKLPFKRTVYNVDGTLNHHGTIDRACNLLVSKGNKKARQRFYVTNLGRDRFILGYPWFREFQPDTDWANGMLRGPTIQMETLLFGTLQQAKGYLKERKGKDTIFKAREILPQLGVTPLIKGGPVEVNRTHTAVEMAHKYA